MYVLKMKNLIKGYKVVFKLENGSLELDAVLGVNQKTFKESEELSFDLTDKVNLFNFHLSENGKIKTKSYVDIDIKNLKIEILNEKRQVVFQEYKKVIGKYVLTEEKE